MKAWIFEPRFQNCQTVLGLLGECTEAYESRQLEDRLRTLLRGETTVVIDLTRTTGLDHIAVTGFCTIAGELSPLGRALRLINVPETFRELFEEVCRKHPGMTVNYKPKSA